MSERANRRKGGGRAGRREARGQSATAAAPFIERNIPYVEILSEENLQLIEHNADRLLAEIGIDFLDDPEVLELFKEAGADIDGTRVRFPTGMCRQMWHADTGAVACKRCPSVCLAVVSARAANASCQQRQRRCSAVCNTANTGARKPRGLSRSVLRCFLRAPPRQLPTALCASASTGAPVRCATATTVAPRVAAAAASFFTPTMMVCWQTASCTTA